jgi:LysM repeat protein
MRLRSLVCTSAALLTAVIVPADSLHAAPPTTRVVAAAAAGANAQWITHEVVPGERLTDIADRYAVSSTSILRWNKLDPKRPQFWVGEQLRIQTRLPGRRRHKVSYIVRPNDTWEKIAKRFGVAVRPLQSEWNLNEATLQAGHQLSIWVEPGTTERPPEPEPPYALCRIPAGGHSFGRPDHGRLMNGVQIPENPALYSLRNLEHSYGSTHAIDVMQRAIAAFRTATGFDRPVTIWDMSMERGGHFGPHKSHRTGRDVDIAMLLRPGFQPGSGDRNAVDWEATWHLVRAFIRTGEVRYIFLARMHQVSLYKAAKACGATRDELDIIIQYPRLTKVGIVRHSPGHTGHLHVRFTCGENESGCDEI